MKRMSKEQNFIGDRNMFKANSSFRFFYSLVVYPDTDGDLKKNTTMKYFTL